MVLTDMDTAAVGNLVVDMAAVQGTAAVLKTRKEINLEDYCNKKGQSAVLIREPLQGSKCNRMT